MQQAGEAGAGFLHTGAGALVIRGSDDAGSGNGWPPAGRYVGAQGEYGDDRDAEGGGQVAGSGVRADEDVHAFENGSRLAQRTDAGKVEDQGGAGVCIRTIGFYRLLSLRQFPHSGGERIFAGGACQYDVEPFAHHSGGDICEAVDGPALFVHRQTFADMEAADRPFAQDADAWQKGGGRCFFLWGGDDDRQEVRRSLAADGAGVVELDVRPVAGDVAVYGAHPNRVGEEKTVGETTALSDAGRDTGERSEPRMRADRPRNEDGVEVFGVEPPGFGQKRGGGVKVEAGVNERVMLEQRREALIRPKSYAAAGVAAVHSFRQNRRQQQVAHAAMRVDDENVLMRCRFSTQVQIPPAPDKFLLKTLGKLYHRKLSRGINLSPVWKNWQEIWDNLTK